MRVISQNGLISLPFENSVFYVLEDSIYAKSIGNFERIVAVYNSKKEATEHLRHLSHWSPVTAYQFPKRKVITHEN